jgi:hypothetical protein
LLIKYIITLFTIGRNNYYHVRSKINLNFQDSHIEKQYFFDFPTIRIFLKKNIIELF